ncbi:MAG: cofactor-independent phosphoglycerate mutase [Thermoanaerobaculaceae bacterium]|nr:cofactor-independent phosphoglycerate mutase [Thermoanaerobaculaceae bacterium]MDI9620707.1 cofactor-independent phosphoglycerate mutase [Acidobacteriota bacterium]HPW55818.1 cofactor-independent phosphoglycerate mutase [Thermoanaerobaculaceae bacterium]
MKAIIVLGDGMSDRPLPELDGRTPLQAARKPHLDEVARRGRVGLFQTIEPGWPLGSDVANLSVLGYDGPRAVQGRAVLEAAAMGVELGPEDVALRCNLIAIEGGRIKNHSAGHIDSDEAAEIVRDLDTELGGGRGRFPVTFHPGVSYRHLLVLRGGWADPAVVCAPPHDHVGEKLGELLPSPRTDSPAAQRTAERLVELYTDALPILASHPVNARRRAAGKDVAGAIWTWSPGRRPTMATMQERFGVKGAVISAVDLLRGLGRLAGMTVIEVPGATGLWDTNYEGKAQQALEALADHDFVYVHVEASDEASHARDLALKIRCLEMLDERLVRHVLAGVRARGLQAVISVLPDHPTPVSTGAHASDPVPVAIWDPRLPPDAVQGYDEVQAAAGSLGMLRGDEFIRLALGLPARAASDR